MPIFIRDNRPLIPSRAIANQPGSQKGRSMSKATIQRYITFSDSGEQLDANEAYERIQPQVEEKGLPEKQVKAELRQYDKQKKVFTNVDELMGVITKKFAPPEKAVEADAEATESAADLDEKKNRTTVEEAALKVFNLDSLFLYRAENFDSKTTISKENITLTGFFSTSLAYAKQYAKEGAKSTKYNTVIKVTLSKPIGNVLIELIKSADAFSQNAGDAGKLLAEKAKLKDAEQQLVQKARETRGILAKGTGKVLTDSYAYDKTGAAERSNTPNAVMIKQEKGTANIEITSRLRDMTKGGEGVLVPHPIDPYVTKVEKVDLTTGSSTD